MRMKPLLTVILLSVALVVPSFTNVGTGHSHGARNSSKKSQDSGGNGGTYQVGNAQVARTGTTRTRRLLKDHWDRQVEPRDSVRSRHG